MIETLPEVASIVLSNGGENVTGAVTEGTPAIEPSAAAAIAVGLAALGTGYAQRGIGAAAVGAVAEDSDNFVSGLIFTAIPETLIIIAFVTIFVA
jgi:V/A-type H+-transporting ATPase subunit K